MPGMKITAVGGIPLRLGLPTGDLFWLIATSVGISALATLARQNGPGATARLSVRPA